MSAGVAFGPTANPDAYVPWSGSERALARLVRWALEESTPIRLLAGAPGMGKTLILKLLAARTANALRGLQLAYPECERDALAAFLGRELGVPGGDGSDALLAALRADGSPPVLLLVDEGELLSRDAARFLLELATSAAGALRVVVAVTRDESCAELEALFGSASETVRIEGAMSKAEVTTHVRAQLARAGIDARLGARFDHATLARLHARSEGIPASLQSLAAALLFEAQRERGEIRFPPTAARPDRALPRAAAKMPRDMFGRDAVVAREAPRRIRRVPLFTLGIALGVASGIALTQLAPELLRARGVAHLAAPSEETAALAPVATAPPEPVAAPPIPAEPIAAEPPPPPPAAEAPVPAPAPIAVSFNSDPWARIEVDGALVGVTPIAAHPVAPGRHRITAQLADGRVLERELEIDEAANRHIAFP